MLYHILNYSFAVGIGGCGEIPIGIERERRHLPVLRGDGYQVAVDIPLDGGRITVAIRYGAELPGQRSGGAKFSRLFQGRCVDQLESRDVPRILQ